MLRELPPPSADHKTGHTKSLANPAARNVTQYSASSIQHEHLHQDQHQHQHQHIYLHMQTETPRSGDPILPLYSASSFSSVRFVHASNCCLLFSLCIFHIFLFSSSSSCPVCIKTHPLIYSASLSAFCHSKSRRKEFRQKSQTNCVTLYVE